MMDFIFGFQNNYLLTAKHTLFAARKCVRGKMCVLWNRTKDEALHSGVLSTWNSWSTLSQDLKIFVLKYCEGKIYWVGLSGDLLSPLAGNVLRAGTVAGLLNTYLHGYYVAHSKLICLSGFPMQAIVFARCYTPMIFFFLVRTLSLSPYKARGSSFFTKTFFTFLTVSAVGCVRPYNECGGF